MCWYGGFIAKQKASLAPKAFIRRLVMSYLLHTDLPKHVKGQTIFKVWTKGHLSSGATKSLYNVYKEGKNLQAFL